MLRWKHLLLIQVRMQLPNDVSISHRGAGGDDLHNEMRGIRLTGLREVDFVSRPGGTFLPTVAGLRIIGGSNQDCLRRQISVRTPWGSLLAGSIVFHPHPPQ